MMPYEVSPPDSTDELSCSGITTDAGSTGEGVRHSVYSWRDGMQDQFVTHDDVSSESDPSDQEPDYSTDQTSPLSCKPDVSVCTDDEEVDDFRDREYPQLRDKVYLDTGGSMLYAKSLIEAFSADLISNLYGNPHSASTPAALAGHRIDEIRVKALRFFNADPKEWDLVFTANATAAIKLVIECMRDQAAVTNTPIWYGYHKDAHTSLVGVRELTKMHRCFSNDEEVENWIKTGGIGGARARQIGLFAYPGQSNMTGRRLPLSWCGQIRRSMSRSPTYTLLDAAALASTAQLDLSDVSNSPDFVALSFYKIFGFPNIGALLVRRESAHILQARRYFGGGTVDMIITLNDNWHAMKASTLHDRLEDGTLPFHSIFALEHAIDTHERLYGPEPMKFISQHTSQLAVRLYQGLTGLRHCNGRPLAVIYKDPSAVYGDPSTQGATIAFNIQRSDGSMLGYADVEAQANAQDIYVRSGSLCNPGGVATYLQWSPPEMRQAYASGHRCSNPTQIMMGKPTGVIRVSLGAMNIARDVDTFLRFIASYVDHSGTIAVPSTVVAHTSHPVATLLVAQKPMTNRYSTNSGAAARPMSTATSIATSITPSMASTERSSIFPITHTAASSVSLPQPQLLRQMKDRALDSYSTTDLALFPSPPSRPELPSSTPSSASVPILLPSSFMPSQAPSPSPPINQPPLPPPTSPIPPTPLLLTTSAPPLLAPSAPPLLTTSSPPLLGTSTAPLLGTSSTTLPNPYIIQSQAHLLPSRTFRARHRTMYHQQLLQQHQQQHLMRASVALRDQTHPTSAPQHPTSAGPCASPMPGVMERVPERFEEGGGAAARTQRNGSVDERISALPSKENIGPGDADGGMGKKGGRLFGRGGVLRKEKSVLLRK